MNYINKELPEFNVNAYQAGELKTVTKNDLLGKWSIIFFYPADFSFVCPTELSELQDLYEEFKAAGAEIYSVSVDSQYSHMSWLRRQKLLVRFNIRCCQIKSMN